MLQAKSAWTCLCVACLAPHAWCQAAPAVSRINPEHSNEAVRQVRLLDAYVQQNSWSEAAELIVQMIEAYPHQVLPVEGASPPRFVSIRSYCHARLAEMPQEAVAQYRARVDGQANALWSEFERTGDESRLLRIADEYFCSSVGGAALERLGDRALSRGWVGEAVAWWARILPAPLSSMGGPENDNETSPGAGVPRHPDPDVNVARVVAKWAIAQRLYGDDDAFERGLRWLEEHDADAAGELAGRNGRYTDVLTDVRDDQAIFAAPTARADWPTFGGGFTRTKTAPRPIRIGAVQRRWGLNPPPLKEDESAVVDMDPRFLQPFPRMIRRPKREGLVCHPVTSGPYVFVSDGARLLQFHVDQDEPVFHFNLDVDNAGPSTSAGGSVRHTLSISGRHLFARTGALTILAQPPFPGRGVSTTSRLFCFDRVQRSLRWHKRADELGVAPPVVFEGAPVALGNQVLVGLTRADAMSTSYIVCLDADSDSGTVLWKRLVCEAANDQNAPFSPDQNLLTLADRTVYYCTNLGAIAALDVPTAKLKWIVEYEMDESNAGRAPAPDVNPCVYDHGRLFVAPAGGAAVYCLDAQTGRTLWRRRAPAAQILGVAKGLLVVAGSRLSAIDVQSGRTAWTFPENMPGTAGRGVLAGDFVYWPTASEIHVVDQQTGQRRESAISLLEGLRLKPGNLIPGDGYVVLAQNRQLVVLRPNRWLKEESLKLVQENPQSAEAHLQLAQAAADDEDFSLAIAHFQQAARLAPADQMRDGRPLADAARSKLFEARLAEARGRLELAAQSRGSVRDAAIADAERCYRDAAREAVGPEDRFRALQFCATMKARFGRVGEALAVYHEMLAEPKLRDALVDAGPGVRRLAADLIADELAELARVHGDAIYKRWDGSFQELVEVAADPAAVFEAAARFPLAESRTPALLDAADALRREGDVLGAQRALRFAARRPGEPADVRENVEARILKLRDFVHGSNTFAATAPGAPDADGLCEGLVVARRLSNGDLFGEPVVVGGVGARPLFAESRSAKWANLAAVDGDRILYRPGPTGQTLWEAKLGESASWVAHTAAGLVCGSNDRLASYDYKSGVLLWEAALDSSVDAADWKGAKAAPAPTTFSGSDPRRRTPSHAHDWMTAYCIAPGGRIVAVDLDFGRIQWELDPLAAADASNVDDRLQPHLQIVGSRLLAWSNRDAFVIDRDRGEIVGRVPILHDAAGLPAAAAGERILLVGGRDRIVAVHAETAETLWTKSTGWPSWDPPILFSNGHDAMLAILDGYALSRLDPATGEPLWEVAATKSPRSGFDRLGFAREDRFYLGAPEGLDCRSLEDGRLLWRAEADGLVGVAVDARRRLDVKIVGLEKGRGLPTVKAWNLRDGSLDWACRIEPLRGDVRLASMDDAPAILPEGRTAPPADSADAAARP